MKYRILNLDDSEDAMGENFSDCEVEFNSAELPLTLYFGKTPADIIGVAIVSVDKKEKAVFAQIKFNKATPEQIKVYKGLAPCIGARVLERSEEDERDIKKIKIDIISLDILNADSRIGSLERQEKNAKQAN